MNEADRPTMTGSPRKPTYLDRVRKHLRYIRRNPGVLPRAMSNYVRMALGTPRLRGIEFAVNFDCFARCSHCSISRLTAKAPDRPLLTLPQMKSAVAQCLELGALNINITGGEALLFPHLGEIIAAAHPRNTVVSVATNGVPMTASTARALARWGVSIVTMSLDSADPATHEALRGVPGCFEKLMRAVDLVQDAGIEVYLCTILTKENIRNGDIRRMIELAEAKGTMLTVNLPCGVGGWEGRDVYLDAGEREFHRRLLSHPNVRWEGSSNYFRDGCPAGIEKLYISPYGDVMPCTFLHVSFGNLTDKSLAEIWADLIVHEPFNRVHDLCLVGEDEEFRRRWVEPISDSAVHPMPASEHPALRRDQGTPLRD